MDVYDALTHIGLLVPGSVIAGVDVAPDTWFKVAAILTLWAYVLFGPDREPTES